MYLDPKSRVAGLPALDVRRFLQFARFDQWRPGLMVELLGVSSRKARRVVRELVRLGLVDPVPKAPTPETYTRTLAGSAMALASAATPIRRATAERKLAEFLARVRTVNASEYYLVSVKRVLLFGSYLAGKERPNDVDLAVELYRKERDWEKYRELQRQRSHDSGRQFRNISEWMSWPQLEVLYFLKSRSRAIGLHSVDDEILNRVKTRVVFKAADAPE